MMLLQESDHAQYDDTIADEDEEQSLVNLLVQDKIITMFVIVSKNCETVNHENL